MKNKESVLQVIKETVRKHGVLSAGLFAAVCGAVIFALLPPLILAQLIDVYKRQVDNNASSGIQKMQILL